MQELPSYSKKYFNGLVETLRAQVLEQLTVALGKDGQKRHANLVKCLEVVDQAQEAKKQADTHLLKEEKKQKNNKKSSNPANDDDDEEEDDGVERDEDGNEKKPKGAAAASPVLEKARQAQKDTTKALNKAINKCLKPFQGAMKPFEESLLSSDFDDTQLVQLVMLQHATTTNLRDYCASSPENAQLMTQLFENVDLQRCFLEAGAPKKGDYLRAMQIYTQIQPSDAEADQQQVLERLRVAVALELSEPLLRYGYNDRHVDAVARYQHYEQAYLAGELDPIFPRLSTWELRWAVNSNATDEDLSWGRTALRNYRPDLVLSDDSQWRYCQIVKSDMAYCVPTWLPGQTRDYAQMIAGGGKCGPRAWWGRFSCQAFGVPIWGVKQPGHAAMTRWTAQGWKTCLGGGWHRSEWEGRFGLDFLLEVQARNALHNDNLQYMQRVLRLEWIGAYLFEKPEDNKSVRKDCIPSAKSYYTALAFLQRKQLVADAEAAAAAAAVQGDQGGEDAAPAAAASNMPIPQELAFPAPPSLKTQWELLKHNKSKPDAIAMGNDDNGEEALFLPASCASAQPKGRGKKKDPRVQVLKSGLGGQQVYLSKDGSMSYTLSLADYFSSSSADAVREYDLTVHVCTLHRNTLPLLVTVASAAGSGTQQKNMELETPYTRGLWSDTNPLRVTVSMSGETKITLARQARPFGVAIKYIKLKPV